MFWSDIVEVHESIVLAQFCGPAQHARVASYESVGAIAQGAECKSPIGKISDVEF